MLKIFIKTANEKLERDQNEILESSFDESLVKINSEQDLKIQWDDDNYKNRSFIHTQIFVETNIDGEKINEFIFIVNIRRRKY
jgi:hypothetical protein